MECLYHVKRVALLLFLFIFFAILESDTGYAQDSKDFAVLLSATVQSSPAPAITLRWNTDTYARRYLLFRKEKSDENWPPQPFIQLDSSKIEYIDTDVEKGIAYEYQVWKQCVHPLTETTALNYIGSGYICSGIEVPPTPARGRVLLLIDTTMTAPLATELQRLERDLINEGWEVARRSVRRAPTFNAAAVAEAKEAIMQEYTGSNGALTSVFIIGRVAVPYSGRFNPDGHDDHVGAWPSDGYYGDIDDVWSDELMRDTSARRPENRNIPGDGKFDQTQFPSSVELQVGRVDFHDMPAFSDSETELLRKYLNKNHAFRMGEWNVKMGGIIDDNFSAATYQEAFASAGWRNISVFGGADGITSGDWFTTLGDTTTYLWAYGCGGGIYTGAGGVGGTGDFATKPARAVFTMLFGSYFGDWDSQNNFLRAALCSNPTILTCSWVARPQWYFHHMALGETIGYSTVLSQNNQSTYIPNIYYTQQYPNGVLFTVGNRMVHAALLGDPTLRAQMNPLQPPGSLRLKHNFNTPSVVAVEWEDAPGNEDGYFIYRAKGENGAFTLLDSTPVAGLVYNDSSASGDVLRYRVHAAVLRRTASGTYYDIGKGIESDIRLSSVESATIAFSCAITPNPAHRSATIVLALPEPSSAAVDIHDLAGNLVTRIAPGILGAGEHRLAWDLTDARGTRVPGGIYIAKVSAMGGSMVKKIVVMP